MSFTKYCPPAVDRFELPAIDLFGKEFSKMASHRYIPPKIEEYLKTAKPIEDGRIILVHGLGSYETWGGNRNGDGFPEIMEGPDGIKEATLINEDPDNDWGYPTFMKYAYSYRDHKNWDPKLSIGGKVILAAWNPEMHRVEIVMPVTKQGALDVVEAIDNGDPVMVSMGCRVAYDSCTICHNKAKNRSEYCKHASHEMGKLYPDGRKVAVLNPRPKFFDISVVKRGADRAAVMLKKVASDNEDWPERKKISVFKASGFKDSADKHSEIKKRIQLDVMGTETDSLEGAERKLEGLLLPLDLSTQEKLPAKVAAMLRSNPEMMIPALTAAGIILQPSEFPDISTSKLSMDHRHPEIWANIDLQDLMIKRSMFDPFLSMRLFRKATLAKVGMLKVASSAKGSPAHVSFSKLMTSTFCDTGKLAKWLGQVSKDYHVISALKDGHRKMASFWQGVEIPSKEIAEKTLSSMDKLAEIAGDSVPPFARSSETSLYSLLKTSGIPSGMPGPTPGRFDGIKKTMKDWWANKGNNPLLGTAKHVARDVGNVTGVGSGGAFPFIPGVAAAAVPLIGSAYYQQKQNEGEDPGMIGNFLAKHPFLTSAAALAGAMKLHSMGNNYRAAKMPPAVPPHASDVVGL